MISIDTYVTLLYSVDLPFNTPVSFFSVFLTPLFKEPRSLLTALGYHFHILHRTALVRMSVRYSIAFP